MAVTEANDVAANSNPSLPDYDPCQYLLKDDQEGTDVWALVRGYITLTPLRLDVGDTDAIAALRALEAEGTPPGFVR